MNEPLCSLIVPAWRGGPRPPVAALIDSVRGNAGIPVEVVVVCNGQDAALVEYVRSAPGVTRSALLSDNAGVARGWNVGAHLSLGKYLVFANEDVVVGGGCLEGLVGALQRDATLGLVGPKGATWEVGPSQARHVDYVSGQGLVPCDAVSGFLFAMPREVLERAGYFDDAYAPCSYEEIDIAMAVKKAGFTVAALGGLAFEHEWGVSAWDGGRPVPWMGGVETIGEIGLRNQARLVRKWGASGRAGSYGDSYYDATYFERHHYLEAMTRPRTIRGRTEPPLVQTMANMIVATGVLAPGARVLDVGCAYGLLIGELLGRGYDPWGVDFSGEVVEASAVRDRIWHGNALRMPVDRRFDVVVAADIYEHLNDAEARILTQRIGAVSDVLVAIVNKSRHEPSHVNIQSNRRWLKMFAECGFGFDAAATWRGRARYLQDSAGTEEWHRNLLVLDRARTGAARNLATRLLADASGFWRVAGAVSSRRG